jgi:hypothetical protein
MELYDQRLLTARPLPPRRPVPEDAPAELREQIEQTEQDELDTWKLAENQYLARAFYEISRVALTFDSDDRRQLVEMLAVIAPDPTEKREAERSAARWDAVAEALRTFGLGMIKSSLDPRVVPKSAPAPSSPTILVGAEQIAWLRTRFGDSYVAMVLREIGVDPKIFGIEVEVETPPPSDSEKV